MIVAVLLVRDEHNWYQLKEENKLNKLQLKPGTNLGGEPGQVQARQDYLQKGTAC